MSKSKKTDLFYEKLEKAGLMRAMYKIEQIANDVLEETLEDIIDDAMYEEERPQCRIRYCEKDAEGNECYIFEIRQDHNEEFGFCMSFRLINDMLSYQALTQIRELKKMGYDIYFA